MNILAIADRPPQKKITDILNEQRVDLICTLGDLDFFQIKDLQSINNIPKIGIYGNHCSGKYFESLGIENMHLKTKNINGLIFGGFEGSLRYKESKIAKMYTQEESIKLLANFPYVDIMLAHSPPFGINDEPNDSAHAGLIGLKNYIEEKKPKYLLHGHTYPDKQNLKTNYLKTKIIYIYQEKIINIKQHG